MDPLDTELEMLDMLVQATKPEGLTIALDAERACFWLKNEQDLPLLKGLLERLMQRGWKYHGPRG